MALKRDFYYMRGTERISLPDIDPGMSADDIRRTYAHDHPVLLNAKIISHEPDTEGVQSIGFTANETAKTGKTSGSGPATATGGSVEFKPSIGKKG